LSPGPAESVPVLVLMNCDETYRATGGGNLVIKFCSSVTVLSEYRHRHW